VDVGYATLIGVASSVSMGGTGWRDCLVWEQDGTRRDILSQTQKANPREEEGVTDDKAPSQVQKKGKKRTVQKYNRPRTRNHRTMRRKLEDKRKKKENGRVW
jgi:hypothetical protein